jgi:hypothetical protein
MGLTLESIVARLDDPESAIVWLDPSLPEALWDQLPAAIGAQGYRVLNLDEEGAAISSLPALFNALARHSLLPAPPIADGPALQEWLQNMPPEGKGWVILFHRPEALRQVDEVAFEDFLDTLDAVHESRLAAQQPPLWLIVRD